MASDDLLNLYSSILPKSKVQVIVTPGDIASAHVEIIVNPTKGKLTEASGISNAIAKKAGQLYLEACQQVSKQNPGVTVNRPI